MLYGILILSLALVGGTFIYMLLFELDNIKISYPQFISLLENRGVGQLEYYKFAFFRESVEDVFEDYYTEEIKGLIENIDMNQSPIKILIDTVHQQLVINLYLADHEAYLPKLVVFLPGIGFMTDSLVKYMKGRKVFEKLIYLSGIVLFLFVCFFGLLFSTDTIRWIGNAVLTFTIFSLFMLFYSESNNGKTLTSISKLPDGVYYSYLALCFLIPVM